ncbi:2-hydroxyhepta-2,4-diene-1,7-dioate isomerase [Photobacterium rosenbergii]|uniref:2-hydroxyhepta-2,4-diene-1,7-dioate isomerase n=1 Tax=Photobacterium rosenbergii TaxID=294936 RepID=A0A2T3NAV0_9GAMM|nr:fumarylacetoacetate hydrolase family protein [Photobacterium rosenbergii]PSW10868.1 2-hydroxyhepta-2,4-diene-1,7-dioate isomerase [Photobacterium rosenbergii]
MKRARVEYKGKVLEVIVNFEGDLVTASGEVLPSQAVKWLCPVENPGTIFALGLNYADHASELAFEPPKEPLVFLKGGNTLTGHLQPSYRPDNIEFMHYECELVAVIGKSGKNIKRDEALDYVAGYTICNDYAIRDYLENYYRPNLRVKSRDSLCPIGPWIVDTGDIADVSNLALETRVNGELTQQGTTADMIFDIPFLIEYLSSFMTLNEGDLIATGTPKGLKDIQPGDVVSCSIEGIGTLENPVLSEKAFYGELTD